MIARHPPGPSRRPPGDAVPVAAMPAPTGPAGCARPDNGTAALLDANPSLLGAVRV